MWTVPLSPLLSMLHSGMFEPSDGAFKLLIFRSSI